MPEVKEWLQEGTQTQEAEAKHPTGSPKCLTWLNLFLLLLSAESQQWKLLIELLLFSPSLSKDMSENITDCKRYLFFIDLPVVLC